MKGLEKLLRNLENVGGNAPKVMEKGVKQGLKLIQGNAKLLAPVDSGELRNSIQTRTQIDGGKVTGEVYTPCGHAVYVELGTGQRGENSPIEVPPNLAGKIHYKQDWKGQPAQPYMYPAAKAAEPKIPGIVVAAVQKEIVKLAKGGGVGG